MRKNTERIAHGVFILIISALSTGNIIAQQIAFPGAEGYGKYVSGGRGGHVVAVTNLLDATSDPPEGSFRWALDQGMDTIDNPVLGKILVEGKLTIVFRVSGIIELQGKLSIDRDNLTIAGQSAPGDGICFKNWETAVRGENIIIRYLRFRPGLDAGAEALSHGVEGLNVENCRNVIVDHCSFGWANEECAIFYDVQNLTVQWCIAHEGLYNAGHDKGSRSYGGVWGGQGASIHHNLLAHNRSRTIRFNGARSNDKHALVDYRNNVNYNWGGSGACYGGEIQIAGGSSRANMVNNYYKPGPATSSSHLFIAPTNNTFGFTKFYINGNYMHGSPDKTANNWNGVSLGSIPLDQIKYTDPFRMREPLPTETAEDAFQSVLSMVGAVYPRRDTVDARVIHETRNGTATGTGSYGGGVHGIIDNPDVVGGYPEYQTYDVPDDVDEDGMDDAWELANSLDPGDPEDRNEIHESGYTMLEMYLNGLVADYTQILDPVVHIRGIADDHCVGANPVSMVGSPRGGYFEGGTGFTVIGDSVIFNPENTGDYELKYVYSDGVDYTDSVTEILTVHPLPEASIVGLDTSYQVGDPYVFLTGDPDGGVFLEGLPEIQPTPTGAVFKPNTAGEFEIFYRYIDTYGCEIIVSAKTTVYPANGTGGISSIEDLGLYPNPAADLIQIASPVQLSKAVIYNLAGIKVKEIELHNKNTIQIGELGKGIYYIEILSDEGIAVRKFVKM